MTREEKLNYIALHYMPFMWKKAYSVLSDMHEAEDACQEAFIKLMKVADEIEDVEGLRARALCVIVAKNTAIDMARKTGRIAPAEDVYLDLAAMDEQAPSPEQSYETGEELRFLAGEIEKLPDRYKEVLTLRCLNELSTEQTAKLLGCTPNSVNIRLTRARKLLKERLERVKESVR